MPENKTPKDIMRTAWILVIGAIAPMLDSTMVNIALNKLMLDFHSTLTALQWSVTGFVLALGAAVPISGWLMNHFNGKKVYAAAMFGFSITSFLSGIAWNVPSFITFRVFQGFFGGIISMLVMALMVKSAGKERLGRIIAIVTTPMILGPILGPVLGGFIVQYLDWRWIFFTNVPIALISFALIAAFLPNFEAFDKKAKLDLLGTILVIGFSLSFIYGLIAQSIIFCGLGLVLVLAYIGHNQFRKNQTVMPLKLFKQRNFTAANIGVFLAGSAINGPMLLMPLFFQNIKHFTATETALILVPQGIGMIIARPYIGKFIDKIGAKRVVLLGLAISLLGSLPFIAFTVSSNIFLIGAVLFVRGVGIGAISIPMTSDIYMGIATSEIPGASVANQMIENLGASFGTAAISAIATISYQAGFALSAAALLLIAIPALFLTDKLA